MKKKTLLCAWLLDAYPYHLKVKKKTWYINLHSEHFANDDNYTMMIHFGWDLERLFKKFLRSGCVKNFTSIKLIIILTPLVKCFLMVNILPKNTQPALSKELLEYVLQASGAKQKLVNAMSTLHGCCGETFWMHCIFFGPILNKAWFCFQYVGYSNPTTPSVSCMSYSFMYVIFCHNRSPSISQCYLSTGGFGHSRCYI